MLLPGDPVPSFYAHAAGNPRYSFDSVAGRYVVVSFIGGVGVPGAHAFIDRVRDDRSYLDDRFASMFIVTQDREGEASGLLYDRYPGIRVFWDPDRAIAGLFGCIETSGHEDRLRLHTWILDPALRVLRVLPISRLQDHWAEIAEALDDLEHPDSDSGSWAPVLQVPNVLERALCQELIEYAERTGLADSGFMRTEPATGKTVLTVDYRHKRRSDCSIEDERLRAALQHRIHRRLIPQIERAFQFRATRIERCMVARYDAQSGGHFRPHKDNTTLGTAHRRFAVSIGLDADGYEGGDLRFPEFGPRTYRPPSGGAIAFSCSLLHEVLPVTRGKRFAVLPFLYDEEAARLRLANAGYLQDAELRRNVIASVNAIPGPTISADIAASSTSSHDRPGNANSARMNWPRNGTGQ